MKLDELAAYVKVLAGARDRTQRGEDRPMYEARLAAAARMFAAIHTGDDAELKRLIKQERHGYGWSYLSGDEGERAHAAWAPLRPQWDMLCDGTISGTAAWTWSAE